MNELKNKHVNVTFAERFNGNSTNAPSLGFAIDWNDIPESKWDTYREYSAYAQESKLMPCWQEIVRSFNTRTKPRDIGRIVSKYTKTEGQYHD